MKHLNRPLGSSIKKRQQTLETFQQTFTFFLCFFFMLFFLFAYIFKQHIHTILFQFSWSKDDKFVIYYNISSLIITINKQLRNNLPKYTYPKTPNLGSVRDLKLVKWMEEDSWIDIQKVTSEVVKCPRFFKRIIVLKVQNLKNLRFFLSLSRNRSTCE